MKIRKSVISSFTVLIIVLLIASVALADTIKLKDGSVLKGKVVSYGQRKFTIVVYIGGTSSQHVIPVEEIESVEFDSDTGAGGRSGLSSPVASTPTTSGSSPGERAAREPVSTTNPNESTTGEGGSGAVIAEKTVSVAAAADWTSTEIRLQRGQRIIVNAGGEVDVGENQRSGPEGVNIADNRKLIPNRPTGALIAVVGDDNDDFIFIGAGAEFIAPHNGILFLSVNEGNLKDNNGAFVAKVKVFGAR